MAKRTGATFLPRGCYIFDEEDGNNKNRMFASTILLYTLLQLAPPKIEKRSLWFTATWPTLNYIGCDLRVATYYSYSHRHTSSNTYKNAASSHGEKRQYGKK
jgi:hypothetical protein